MLGLLAGLSSARVADADPSKQDVVVRTVDALRSALRDARPGTRVKVAPGTYAGGLYVEGLLGAPGRPIVVEAERPDDPPRFVGGTNGLHLSRAAHVEVSGLVFEGATGNGVNVDDGGAEHAGSSHHLVLRGLVVRDVGPEGNRDGLKLSGLADVEVLGGTIERWGRGGSGIDLVGCHRVRIEGVTLRHTEGLRTPNGVQAKGGSRDVVVRRCRFEFAGGRGVNAGGSTGLAYFRPALAAWKGARFEAKDLVIEGNVFVGGDTPVAFVGVDGATFRFNTVLRPARWALRLLQETRAEGFVPTRRVTFADNVVVFRAAGWSEGGVNVGDGTEPGSTVFQRNVWWCEDAPARTRSLLRLPTEETRGVYGEDPGFVDEAKGDLRGKPGRPAARAGAHALP